MNTKGTKFLAVLAVMAMAFVGVAVIAETPADDAGTTDTLYLHGTIDADQVCTTANVIVDQNLIVKNGAVLAVAKNVTFEILAGVTLTIDGSGEKQTGTTEGGDPVYTTVPASLIIDPLANFVANGDIIIGAEGAMAVVTTESDGPSVDPTDFIPMTVVNGNVEVSKKAVAYFGERGVIFTENASLNVTSTSKVDYATVAGKIILEKGATASINGQIGCKLVIDAYDGALDAIKGDLEKCYSIPAGVWISGGNFVTGAPLTFKAETVEYDAWVYDYETDKAKKITVIENHLNMGGVIKSGETIETYSTDSYLPLYNSKVDAEEGENFFYSNSAVVIPESFEVRDGGLIVEVGWLYVNGDLTVKKGTSAEDAWFSAESEFAYILVSGTVNMYEWNTNSIEDREGYLYIDGGIVTVKAVENRLDDGYYFPTYGIQGAYFVTDDSDALIVCELEDAIELTDSDTIVVSGQWGWSYSSAMTISDRDRLELEGDAYVISEDITIPSGITIEFANYVIIEDGAVLTIEKDAAVDWCDYADWAIVNVRGEIIDNNSSISGMETGNYYYIYEVVLTGDDYKYEAYMSLTRALETAVAGDEIEATKDVIIDSEVSIPSDVKVIISKEITITENGKLINFGILDISKALDIEIEEYSSFETPSDFDDYFVNENIAIIDRALFAVFGEVLIPGGFYAVGSIGDDAKDTQYFLAPAVAAHCSSVFTEMYAAGEITYNGNLTFTAGDKGGVLYLDQYGTFDIQTITLDGYVLEVANAGEETAYYTPEGFTGVVAVKVNSTVTSIEFYKQNAFAIAIDEDDDETGKTIETVVLGEYNEMDLELNKTVFLSGEVMVGVDFEIIEKITIGSDAILNICDDIEITVDLGADIEKYQIIIDGTLYVSEDLDVEINGNVIINGLFEIADESTVEYMGGIMSVLGSIVVSDEDACLSAEIIGVGKDMIEYLEGLSQDVMDSIFNGTATVSGYVDAYLLIAFAGSNVDSAMIMEDDEEAVFTDVMVNGALFATVYGYEGFIPYIGYTNDGEYNPGLIDFIAVYGYEPVKDLYTDADMTKKVVGGELGDRFGAYEVVYGVAKSKTTKVVFSTISGVELFVDGVNVDALTSNMFKMGTYTISTAIAPGYTGDLVIKMNGVELKGDSFTVTADMVEAYADDDDNEVVIAITGAIEPIPEPNNMSITEILLIVLVVLIAIMAVIVALRLNRS